MSAPNTPSFQIEPHAHINNTGSSPASSSENHLEASSSTSHREFFGANSLGLSISTSSNTSWSTSFSPSFSSKSTPNVFPSKSVSTNARIERSRRSYEGEVFPGIELAYHTRPPPPPQSSVPFVKNSVAEWSPTLEDYPLQVLFQQFVRAADKKMGTITEVNVDSNLTSLLGPGVDPTFDRILKSLGAIALYRPNPVIESILKWRKIKDEENASGERIVFGVSPMKVGVGVSEGFLATTATGNTSGAVLRSRSRDASARERRSLSSTYIFFRALIEIVKQLRPETLSDEFGNKLEDIIFTHFKSFEPDALARSKNKQINMELNVELIGWLSTIRFSTVSDHFIAELEKLNNPLKERQSRVEFMIRGMLHLRLRIVPEEALEETADFLYNCATFFKIAQGSKVKYAWANTFISLMLPIAAVTVAEVNFPSWAKAVELAYPRAFKMMNTPKTIAIGMPLTTTLLAVSRHEFFQQNWHGVLDFCIGKLREKSVRMMALGCISRLTWVYLYRCTEQRSIDAQKRLEVIARTIFKPGQRGLIPSDSASLEHYIQLVYFVLMKYTDWGLTNLVYYLVGVEELARHSITLEAVYPERSVVAIRAFMLMLWNVERGEERPQLPITIDMAQSGILRGASADVLPEKVLASRRFSIREPLEILSTAIGKQLTLLDQQFGNLNVFDERNIVKSNAGFSSNTFAGVTGASQLTEIPQQIIHQYASFGSPGNLFQVSYNQKHQPYFDLLQTLLQSTPRLTPAGIPLDKFVSMISKYTVHVDPELICAASETLIRIARQIDSHVVLQKYSRFINQIEDRHIEIVMAIANGPISAAGSAQIVHGGVLKLYTELLGIWFEQKGASEFHNNARTAEMDDALGGARSIVDEAEATGLLLLCSRLAGVRKYGVQVLRIIANFDKHSCPERPVSRLDLDRPQSILSQLTSHIIQNDHHTRLYDLFETLGQDMMKTDKEGTLLQGQKLPADARERFKTNQYKNQKDPLAQIAQSDNSMDMTIWYTCFPGFVRSAYEYFPLTVGMCRVNICNRLSQMYGLIQAAIDNSKAPNSTLNLPKTNIVSRANSATDELIESWRLYLIFACTTIELTENISTESNSSYVPKKTATFDRISGAKDLFKVVLPHLQSDHVAIREAAVIALGRINTAVYKTLIEEMQPLVSKVMEDFKSKSRQKPYSDAKRNRKYDNLRLEITRIYQITVDCLREDEYLRDEVLMDMLMAYVKETKSFLEDSEVAMEWDFVHLRRTFCLLIERMYDHVSHLSDPSQIMSFETRQRLFKMFEEWCGFGPQSQQTKIRERKMIDNVLDLYRDGKEKEEVKIVIEQEKKEFEFATLRAMASLCRGPIVVHIGRDKTKKAATVQFDVMNLFKWIDAVFASDDSNYHNIGRRALENILIHNQNLRGVLEDVIMQCYEGNPKLQFTQGYFLALAEVITRVDDYPIDMHKTLSLALYKVGDPKKPIRKAAIQLLRLVEERFFVDSCASDYEIGIMSSLPIIYKQTQLLISARLAADHSEQTYAMLLLSEITKRFEYIGNNYQRDVLGYLLPWLRNIDLSVGLQDEEISLSAFVVLTNLYYLTTKYGDIYVKEMEALWLQLVLDKPRNMHAIVMFLIHLGLEKRNPYFVLHAKRILVYLGRTTACSRIIEEIISEINPRSMVPQAMQISNRHSNTKFFVADIEKVLTTYNKKPVFSSGQLALTLLVDFTVEAGHLLAPHLPLLVHMIFVQFDHAISMVCDQTRWLLINLLHSNVIRQAISAAATHKAEALIATLMAKEGKRMWANEDLTHKNQSIQSSTDLQNLVKLTVEAFALGEHDIRRTWGETALKWATTCTVRHIACRSFQCFRALMPTFNKRMLADMLLRLSKTIGDMDDDIRGFALEILITLNHITDSLDPMDLRSFPQLFWTAIACMYIPYEEELLEALSLLETFLNKVDIRDQEVHAELVAEFRNTEWESEFRGLQPLLLKGLRGASSEPKSIALLKKIILLPNLVLVDPSGEARLVFLILGTLPRLLEGLEPTAAGTADSESAAMLAADIAELAEQYDLKNIGRIMTSYSKRRFRSQQDFITQLVNAIKVAFFPAYGLRAIVFLISLLRNKLPYYRSQTLKVLKMLVPYANVNQPSGQGLGITVEAIEPLIQLLQTEFAEEALVVLRESKSLTLVQKTNVLIASEDGVDSGNMERLPDWAVIDPTVAIATTRHNVHAVKYVCMVGTAIDDSNFTFTVEEVDQTDAIQYYNGEDEPIANSFVRNDVDDNILNALDEFEHFFLKAGESVDETISTTPSERALNKDEGYPPFSAYPAQYTDAGQYEYAKSIVNDSLKKSASSTSLRTAYTDGQSSAFEVLPSNASISTSSSAPSSYFHKKQPKKYTDTETMQSHETLEDSDSEESSSADTEPYGGGKKMAHF